ncbi:MAG: 50S ribosomal protein L20 [bacterium ADurb.Bin212]|nr:MAG: 50S ribosomal protein L20 [bacterium ADurb.Bin212]
MRVKRGTVRHAKHKKILKMAKGYKGRRRSVFKLAKQAVLKAGQHSYRDRKNRKRDLRGLWIIKINASIRKFDLSYSKFIKLLSDKKIIINRKLLADLAENEPKAFEAIVKSVK